MNWNSTMGLISTIALFSPIALILVFRLASHRTFSALLLYYFSIFVYNLFTEGYIHADKDLVFYWGLTNNFLDAPLMLSFLLYFSTTSLHKKRLKILIGAFVLFEVVTIIITGYNVNAITIILGPGILVVLSLAMTSFIRQAKIAISNRKATGKALIAAALLFAYGCYGIIYVMYYILTTKNIDDTFLVYFLVTTISSVLLSTGIIFEEKRIKKLSELRVTRRELSDIYAHEKNIIPTSKKVMLDFDREQWN